MILRAVCNFAALAATPLDLARAKIPIGFSTPLTGPHARCDAQGLGQDLCDTAAVVCGKKPEPVSRVAPTTTRLSCQGTM